MHLISTIGISIVISTQLAANSLGPENGDVDNLRRVFSEQVKYAENGRLTLTWLNPNGNNVEKIELKQWNVLGFTPALIAKVEGRPVTCTLLPVQHEITFGDCSVFLEELTQGATSLLRLVQRDDMGLLGCSKSEEKIFSTHNQFRCTEVKN